MFHFSNTLRRNISFTLIVLILSQTLAPTLASALTGGPSTPEFASFQPAGMTEMVDLFSGDFSYNIPLFDIGGYPINLAYQSGSTHEDEASWVGLGWSLNPGAVNRNLRGLPDDFNGDKVVTETRMRPNVNFGVNYKLSGEFLGIDLGKLNPSDSFKLSFGQGLVFNNYKGIGVTNSISLSAGPFSAGINQNTLQGISTTLGLSFGIKKIENTNLSLGISGSYGSRTGLQAISYNISAQSTRERCEPSRKGRDAKVKFKETGSNSAGFTTTFNQNSFSNAPSLEFVNEDFHGSFTTGAAGFGADGRLQIGLDVAVQALKNKHDETEAFGFLNMSAAEDRHKTANVSFDYAFENNGMYIKEKPDLPYTHGTFDLFSVSGQGIGGQFRSRHKSMGYGRDNFSRSNSYSQTLGLEFSMAADGYYGGDIGLGAGSNTSTFWEIENEAFSNFDHKKNVVNSTSQEVYWEFSGEATPTNDDFIDKVGKQKPVTFELGGGSKLLDKLLTRNDLGSTNSDLSPADLAPNFIRNIDRSKKNTSIVTLNQVEANVVSLDKDIRSYSINSPMKTLICNDASAVSTKISRIRAGKQHHISEIQVTKPDGARYHYGVPVYNNTQVEMTFSTDWEMPDNADQRTYKYPDEIDYGNTEATEENKAGIDHYFQKITTPSYVTSWLISAVLSPDYIDRTGDGISPDDPGNGIKFNYTRHCQNYKWRVPVGGFEGSNVGKKAKLQAGSFSDQRDQKAHITFGEKEVWYVHSIESATTIARFYTSKREDGYQVNENGYVLNGDNDDKLQRLDKIVIFAKQDLVTNGEAAKPLQVIHFEYIYSGITAPNSPSGKLILKKVYTTYAGNNTKFQNYAFDYDLASVLPYASDQSDRWGSYSSAIPLSNCSRAEFPYTNQDKVVADKDASAFQLISITTPTNAKIEVTYEADDYAYVQDKLATQMFEVYQTKKSLGGQWVKQFYGNNQDNFEIYDVIGLKLKNFHPSTDVNLTPVDLRNLYFSDMEDDQLFVSFHCLMRELLGEQWERVEGYVKIDPNSFKLEKSLENTSTNFDLITFKIKGVKNEDTASNDHFHPVSLIGFQKMRLDVPTLLYPNKSDFGDEVNFADVKEFVVAQVVPIMQDIKNMFSDFAKNCRRGYFVRHYEPSRSFVKLTSPNRKKIGGGSRVKKVKMGDNWNTYDADGQGVVLSREYNYTKNQDDKIISSGVATWEPMLGNQENVHIRMSSYNQNVRMAPDNTYYSELPYCSALFPGPSVGYSQVTVKDLSGDDDNLGFSIYEFYTQQDCPTVVKNTVKETRPENFNMNLIFFTHSQKYENVSQGYFVMNTDIHGKPKSEAVFNKEGQELSSKTYYYRLPKNETNNEIDAIYMKDTISNDLVSNTVPCLKKDLTIANARLGYDYDIWQDFSQNTDKSYSGAVNFDLDVWFWLFGATVPFPIPNLSDQQVRMRSSTTVKHVSRTPILQSVRVVDNGSSLTTTNLLWDDQTGDVLLTRVDNEFKKATYALNLPAHMAYDLMGQASKNSEFMTKIGLHESNHNIVSSTSMLLPGDELLLYGDDNFTTPCRKVFVVAYDAISPGALVLTDFEGKILTNHDLKKVFSDGHCKVIRSGRRNVQSSALYTLTLMDNPMVGGAIDQGLVEKVLQSQALTYDQAWQTSERIKKITESIVSYDIDEMMANSSSQGHLAAKKLIKGLINYNFGLTPQFPFQNYTRWNLSSNEVTLSTIYNDAPLVSSPTTWIDGASITPQHLQQVWEPITYSPNSDVGELLLNSYSARLGDCVLTISNETPFRLNRLFYWTIDNQDLIVYSDWDGDGYPDVRTGFEISLTCSSVATSCENAKGQYVNPYIEGLLGIWRPKSTYATNARRLSTDETGTDARLANDGAFAAFSNFWQSNNGGFLTKNITGWIQAQQAVSTDVKGRTLEATDALGIFSSEKYGYAEQLVVASGKNVRHQDYMFDSYEDYTATENCKSINNCYTPISQGSLEIETSLGHTGNYSVLLNGSEANVISFEMDNSTSSPTFEHLIYEMSGQNRKIKIGQSAIVERFKPKSDTLLVSAWFCVKGNRNATLNQGLIQLSCDGNPFEASASGERIDGWRKISKIFVLPSGTQNVTLKFLNTDPSVQLLFDDLKIQPVLSSVQGFVYDYRTSRLMATLDDNNFATFYEYDDKGMLIRVKRETERGIVTIKEGRQHLKAEQ